MKYTSAAAAAAAAVIPVLTALQCLVTTSVCAKLLFLPSNASPHLLPSLSLTDAGGSRTSRHSSISYNLSSLPLAASIKLSSLFTAATAATVATAAAANKHSSTAGGSPAAPARLKRQHPTKAASNGDGARYSSRNRIGDSNGRLSKNQIMLLVESIVFFALGCLSFYQVWTLQLIKYRNKNIDRSISSSSQIEWVDAFELPRHFSRKGSSSSSSGGDQQNQQQNQQVLLFPSSRSMIRLSSLPFSSSNGENTRVMFMALLCLACFVRALSLVAIVFWLDRSSSAAAAASASSSSVVMSNRSSRISSNSGNEAAAVSDYLHHVYYGIYEWYFYVLQLFPSLLFLSAYSVLVFFWSKVYYGSQLLSVKLIRPAVFFLNSIAFTIFIVMAALTQSLAAYHQFRSYASFFTGIMHLVIASLFVYYGIQITEQFAQKRRKSRACDSIIRRVNILSFVCPLVLSIRGTVLLSSVFHMVDTHHLTTIHLNEWFSWDALLLLVSEAVPVVLILVSFWSPGCIQIDGSKQKSRSCFPSIHNSSSFPQHSQAAPLLLKSSLYNNADGGGFITASDITGTVPGPLPGFVAAPANEQCLMPCTHYWSLCTCEPLYNEDESTSQSYTSMEHGCYGHRQQQQQQVEVSRQPIGSKEALADRDRKSGSSQQQSLPVYSSHSHHRSCVLWEPQHHPQPHQPSCWLTRTRLETEGNGNSRNSRHSNTYEDMKIAKDHHHHHHHHHLHHESHHNDDDAKFFKGIQTITTPSCAGNPAGAVSRNQTVTGPSYGDWKDRKPAAVLRNELMKSTAASACYSKRKQESPVVLYQTSAALSNRMLNGERIRRQSVAAAGVAAKRTCSPLKTVTTSTTGTAIISKKTSSRMGKKPIMNIDYNNRSNNDSSTVIQMSSTVSSLPSTTHHDTTGIPEQWRGLPLTRMLNPSSDNMQRRNKLTVPLAASPSVASDNLMFDDGNHHEDIIDNHHLHHHHNIQIRGSMQQQQQLPRKQYYNGFLSYQQ